MTGSVATIDAQQDLLARTAQGDMAAFQSLYDQVNRRLYAVAMRIVNDSSLAEDILQESLLKIWRKAGRYEARLGSPIAWMAVITRNTALDLVRTRKPTEELSEAVTADLTVEPVAPPDMRLERALKGLSSDQANALILMHSNGFSHSELAAHLNVPLGTVKSWVRRGTEALRLALAEQANV